MTQATAFLHAQWSLTDRVAAMTTLRSGGVSESPFDSLNLGLHVGDNPEYVQINRQRVQSALGLPGTPVWLRQTHGTEVMTVQGEMAQDENASTASVAANHEQPSFDAAFTREGGHVLSVLTADCLPVVFASAKGDEVAVAHAGWRGLADGVLQNTLACFNCDVKAIHVWLGPGIGPDRFEVGADVRDYYFQQLSQIKSLDEAFIKIESADKWHANLYLLARQVLAASGVQHISGGAECTFSQPEKYYSYRRDGVNSGRMATFVWRR